MRMGKARQEELQIDLATLLTKYGFKSTEEMERIAAIPTPHLCVSCLFLRTCQAAGKETDCFVFTVIAL